MNPNDYSKEFIDADDGFQKDADTYSEIIMTQIRRCVENLSREMIPGQIVYKKDGLGVEKYTEDVRELVIRSISTLKSLLSSYLQGEYKKMYDEKIEKIEEYKRQLGKRKMLILGKGEVEIGNFSTLPAEHPVMKEFTQYKAEVYREIFEILVNCYNKNRAYLKSLESE